MNILLCLSHSIEEADQLRLLRDLGYGVASIGGYIDPGHPHDPKRPPLPDIPCVEAVKTAVDGLGTPDNLGAAQSHIPDAVLDWLGDDGVIIFHHYLDRLYGQWPHIRDWLRGSSRRRVIWRSVGQSVAWNEEQARPFRSEGLERVAYSPKEANIPGYSGHDALIRFWKDPDEWCGWTGEWPGVINITQHLAQRDPYTNYGFWREATRGLALPNGADDGPPGPFALPLGPGSEALGGPGELSYDDMKDWLRRARCYLYTGTQPASYTLGLIEAMMTGIPVVSIGPSWMRIFPYGPDLFEGHEITNQPTTFDIYYGPARKRDDVAEAKRTLEILLENVEVAGAWSQEMRQRAIDLFGKDKIAAEWAAFLG